MIITNPLHAQKDESFSLDWQKPGTLPETRGKLLGVAGPIAGVMNNVFVTGGGANFPEAMPWHGGAKVYYDDLFFYRKKENDSLVRFASAKLPFPLAYATCVSTDKGLVIAGGENDNGVSNKVLLLNWDNEQLRLTIRFLADLPIAVTSPSATVLGDIIYLAGGDEGTKATDQFIYLNLNKPEAKWQQLPPLRQPTSHAVLAAQHDGTTDCIYLIGGRKKNPENPSTLYETVFRFDFKTRIWQKMKSLDHPLSAGTGVAAGSHSILLFGGDTGETFHKTEELIFAIAKEKNDEQKRVLIEEKIKVQSGHPGFSNKILCYNTQTNTWKEMGEIPFDPPVTTVAIKWVNEVIIPGGEIRAGVRTPQIISAKITVK